MSEKPLVRWTVGPSGFRHDDLILHRSVCNFRRIYGDTFDYAICFNGRPRSELDGLGVDLVEQKPVGGMPEPHGVAWKLYPPRLRPHSHELFIDHDLVFVDRLPHIELFLSLPDSFVYTQCPVGLRNYGAFESAIPEGFRLNSGLFGLPPGFSFDLSAVDSWGGYFDEQGFVASSICRQKSLIEVPIEDVWICDGDEMRWRAKAFHFVHDKREEAWARFFKRAAI